MLNLKKWTSIDSSLEQRNNLLVSIFAIVGVLFTATQLVNAIIYQLNSAVFLNSIVIAVLIVVYIINEQKKHKWAKILLLGSINIMLFIFSNVVPKTMGIYFLFFPVIAVSALIFNPNEKISRRILVILPVVLMIILELYNYQFFGDINIHKEVVNRTSYYINLFTSAGILVFVLIYITELNRKIDSKREQISKELRESNDILKKTNTELDHFVYSTSHDLKAPLSSILGLVNLAKLEVKEKKSLEYFDKINGSINKLNLFIRDIINLSRNSRLALSKQSVHLEEVISNVIDNNRYIDGTKSIDFQIDVSNKDSIEIDKSRLEIILNNLISNSLKYHKEKGHRFILISIKKNNEELEIKVKDNGIGIEKERQKKVFDMFYRGHEKSEGSGLGLYIVNDVVNKMGGEIVLASQPDIGTEVRIGIPIDG